MIRTPPRSTLVAVLAVTLLAGCTPTPASAPGDAGSRSAAPRTGTTETPDPTLVTRSAQVDSATPAAPSSTPAASTRATDRTIEPASAKGCTNGRTRIPTSARTTRFGDVDGDGRRDTAFFTTVAPYEFGFATAAGGVYSTPDRLPAAGDHHAWAVGTDGFPGLAIVIDDGLVATPLSFEDCTFRQLTESDGSALTIPIGARAAGGDATTGVACNDQNGGILIEAVQARARSNGRYDIAWSTLQPSGTPGGAEFSGFHIRSANLAPTDPRVQQARASTCWAATTLTVKR